MNIYVGNLSFSTTEDGLRSEFEQYGTVERASVIVDRVTGRSRGFGFVEMPNSEEAQKAVDEMNGKEVDGRTLKVNEAQPRSEGGGGGGWRGGGGGGRRGGGGGGFGGGGGRRGGGGGDRW